jgi:adenylate cyclase
VECAAELARSIRQDLLIGDEPLPVGIGVHAGEAFVGKIGSDTVHDFTALGDTVNTAARLQAEAAAGEVALSEELYQEAPESFPGAQAKEVSLRGKSEPFPIRIYRP